MHWWLDLFWEQNSIIAHIPQVAVHALPHYHPLLRGTTQDI